MTFPIQSLIWFAIAIFGLCVIGYSLRYFYQSSKPNEYLLVIRNGKMIRGNIGISCFVMPLDQIIKIPSLINQVNFKANQVTKEM